MSLIEEHYARVSYYVSKHCSQFEASTWNFVAVNLSTLPIIIYLSCIFITAWTRKFWWFWLGCSMFFNALMIRSVGWILPVFNNGRDQCGAIFHDRPCEEASVLFLIAGFWTLCALKTFSLAIDSKLPVHFNSMNRPETLSQTQLRLIQHTIVIWCTAFLCSFALVSLHMFNSLSVVLGGGLGFFNGVLSIYIYYAILLPNTDSWVLQSISTCFCIDDAVLDSKPG